MSTIDQQVVLNILKRNGPLTTLPLVKRMSDVGWNV